MDAVAAMSISRSFLSPISSSSSATFEGSLSDASKHLVRASAHIRSSGGSQSGLSKLKLVSLTKAGFGHSTNRNRVISRSIRKLQVVRNSQEDPAEIDNKVEETSYEIEKEADRSKEAWSQAMDKLKAEVTNAQELSDESAKKALGLLRDTTGQLLEQAEKARSVLTATAQELPVRGKENLSYVAENAPDPLIKDIAETALKAHYPEDVVKKQGSKIHDFCLGIPYGGLLVAGGLFWFICAGSTSAIRFGVLLGGVLLALSITSLKVWKQGESSLPYIQGQAVITTMIFIRFLRRFSETKVLLPTGITALASAGMLAFYVYVFLSGGNPPKKVKAEYAS